MDETPVLGTTAKKYVEKNSKKIQTGVIKRRVYTNLCVYLVRTPKEKMTYRKSNASYKRKATRAKTKWAATVLLGRPNFG